MLNLNSDFHLNNQLYLSYFLQSAMGVQAHRSNSCCEADKNAGWREIFHSNSQRHIWNDGVVGAGSSSSPFMQAGVKA